MAKKEEVVENPNASALERAVAELKSQKKVQLDHFVLVGQQAKVWPHVSTGNIKIDYVIGEFNYCPGFPRGGITNVYGPEHSGKTTLALHVCAEVIKNGGCVCYIDFENILDTRYAKKLGIPVDDKTKFTLYQPQTLEQGVICLLMMANQNVDVIVLDSVGAAIPKDIMEMSINDFDEGKTGGIGLSARKWSGYLPRIQQTLKDGNTSLIAISQMRSAINTGYGAEDTVQGGKAWKFYSILRLELKPVQKLYNEGVFNIIEGKAERKYYGTKVRVTVKKCKVAPSQGRTVSVECLPNRGFDPVKSLVDLAKNLKVITASGSWLTFIRNDGSEIRSNSLNKFISDISGDRQALIELRDRATAAIKSRTNSDEEMELEQSEITEEEYDDDEAPPADSGDQKMAKGKKGKKGKNAEADIIDAMTASLKTVTEGS